MKESKLLSFIDKDKTYTIHFFEGQKLIHDLAIIHDVKNRGFAYFRDSILSFVPLNAFLKAGENFGLYIDSEAPYFKFKVEMNEAGFLRTLLLPETFSENPSEITGQVRLSKIFLGQSQPYNSIIELNKTVPKDITTKILKTSYQLSSEVILCENSDQSVLISKLPSAHVDKVDKEKNGEELTLSEIILKNKSFLNDVMNKGHENTDDVVKELEAHDYEYLMGKQIEFKCNCSRDRMVDSLLALGTQTSLEEVFNGDESIETRCDYCKTYYKITQKELLDIIKQ